MEADWFWSCPWKKPFGKFLTCMIRTSELVEFQNLFRLFRTLTFMLVISPYQWRSEHVHAFLAHAVGGASSVVAHVNDFNPCWIALDWLAYTCTASAGFFFPNRILCILCFFAQIRIILPAVLSFFRDIRELDSALAILVLAAHRKGLWHLLRALCSENQWFQNIFFEKISLFGKSMVSKVGGGSLLRNK